MAELKIHWQHSVDRMPMCKPVEQWDNRSFIATTDDDKITCSSCKRLLEQMKRELGEEENG